MQSLLYDLRFALRQLRKSIGIALLAIFTLALGVGANTAIFTVIDSVLLRPLPYADSDRLIFIGPKGDKPSFDATSWLDYRDIRAQSTLLQGVAGYSEDIGVMENQDSSAHRDRSPRDPQPVHHAGRARHAGTHVQRGRRECRRSRRLSCLPRACGGRSSMPIPASSAAP